MRLRTSIASLLGVAASALTLPALAQSTIRAPGARPAYSVELEPHFLVSPFNPPGPAGGDGIGAGARATIELVREGFIGKVNDSVGIGFGVDWLHFDDADARGECTDRVAGPNGTSICVEVDGSGGGPDYLFVPVVMQWNFWLTRRWSVFGEPGLFAYFGSSDRFGIEPFAFYAGGRYLFSDGVGLTLRLGYPSLSIGASFLF